MIEPIIRLHHTKEEAFSFEDSPVNRFYEFAGIQLLPSSYEVYTQITDHELGIPLEDWVVKVVDCNSNEKFDITSSFYVVRKFNDINGKPQIQWSLKEIVKDFGYSFVYLEITQTVGQTFYSNVFMITNTNKEFTSHYTYKRYKDEEFQSIRLQSWFRSPSMPVELTTYYETSTKSTVTKSIKSNLIHNYKTETMSFNLLISFMEMITCSYLYVNGVRNSIFEAPEFPKPTNEENFGIMEYILTPKKWDLININTINQKGSIGGAIAKGDFKDGDWKAGDFTIYSDDNGKFNDKFNDKFD
jgi:hypothetical protein